MTAPSLISRKWFAAALILPLFIVWSNSFVAVGFLVGAEGTPARFDYIGYSVARYVTAGIICGLYCLIWRLRESLQIIAEHWRRLLLCGFVMVPGYNLSLAYAQANGVSASVASLTTALNPLFTMVLSVMFLKEKIQLKHFLGLSVAFLGMITIGSAERPNDSIPYSLALLLVSTAPLSWAILSVATKAVSKQVSPILWTFLSLGLGGAMLLPFVGRKSVYSLIKLDQAGWLALSYLIGLCTVAGFLAWVWLLQHFSATSMGFTVFLNPPLTALSKMLLSVFFPAVFIFQIQPREWIGGSMVLLGMALALVGKRSFSPRSTNCHQARNDT